MFVVFFVVLVFCCCMYIIYVGFSQNVKVLKDHYNNNVGEIDVYTLTTSLLIMACLQEKG